MRPNINDGLKLDPIKIHDKNKPKTETSTGNEFESISLDSSDVTDGTKHQKYVSIEVVVWHNKLCPKKKLISGFQKASNLVCLNKNYFLESNSLVPMILFIFNNGLKLDLIKIHDKNRPKTELSIGNEVDGISLYCSDVTFSTNHEKHVSIEVVIWQNKLCQKSLYSDFKKLQI